MQQNEQKGADGAGKEAGAYGKYMGMAFQMIVIIGLFAFAGYKIDEGANHATKWVTALLSLIGVFASLYLVFRTLKS